MHSYSEAGRILGVSHKTISVAATVLGIAEKPHPSNGNGKGLTEAELRLIAKRLGRPVPTLKQRKAALTG
jgi:hypothetical protein